jgi:hypothetical protein
VTDPALAFLVRSRAESQLRNAFAERNAELINLYRHGPYKIEALFLVSTSNYWSVTSQADGTRTWTQAALDAWLYEDLVRQLGAKLDRAG